MLILFLFILYRTKFRELFIYVATCTIHTFPPVQFSIFIRPLYLRFLPVMLVNIITNFLFFRSATLTGLYCEILI